MTITEREAVHQEGVQHMAEALRRILDGEPCLASEPPELAEVARLVERANGVRVDEALRIAGAAGPLGDPDVLAVPSPSKPVAMIEADDARALADDLEKIRQAHWAHWTAQENHIAATAVRHLRLLAAHNANGVTACAHQGSDATGTDGGVTE